MTIDEKTLPSGTPLFGFERHKDCLSIASFVKALEEGASFRPVSLAPFHNSFVLSFDSDPERHDGRRDGGHHRAIATLIADAPFSYVSSTRLPDSRRYLFRDLRTFPLVLDLARHQRLRKHDSQYAFVDDDYFRNFCPFNRSPLYEGSCECTVDLVQLAKDNL